VAVTAQVPVLRPDEIADGAARLEVRPDGSVLTPMAFVDLAAASEKEMSAAAAALADTRSKILVGVAGTASAELTAHLSITLASGEQAAGSRSWVVVPDVDAVAARIASTVEANPCAALALRDLLRLTSSLDAVGDGLVAESFAYSMLLAGAEFARWRNSRPRHALPVFQADPVLVERLDGVLDVRLNRPERRNSFSREVRDALLEALLLPELDPTIEQIRITGRGPTFCSGGDLDEFGSTADVVTAHQVRTTQAVGLAIHRLRDRTVVELHGACIGAGIEVPAFAGRVLARPDVSIRLPELSMGLVPGAGGTVSLPRRIGRWRTEYLALSGQPIDFETALTWGLVDGPG